MLRYLKTAQQKRAAKPWQGDSRYELMWFTECEKSAETCVQHQEDREAAAEFLRWLIYTADGQEIDLSYLRESPVFNDFLKRVNDYAEGVTMMHPVRLPEVSDSDLLYEQRRDDLRNPTGDMPFESWV
jgi:hypothetical protein